jgi:hypothetical protein
MNGREQEPPDDRLMPITGTLGVKWAVIKAAHEVVVSLFDQGHRKPGWIVLENVAHTMWFGDRAPQEADLTALAAAATNAGYADLLQDGRPTPEFLAVVAASLNHDDEWGIRLATRSPLTFVPNKS